jgi:ADP-ribose pyrophosphatase YjhB (NUDIX family)
MPRRYPETPVVAVGVLLLDRKDGRDHVLLIQRGRPPNAGRWTVPGGGVEVGETIEEAALRELAEETGLGCTLGPVVEILDRVSRDADGRVEYHYVILDLLGTGPTGALRAASDCADARWVPVDALGDYDTTDGLEPVIHRAVEMRTRGEAGPYRLTER